MVNPSPRKFARRFRLSNLPSLKWLRREKKFLTTGRPNEFDTKHGVSRSGSVPILFTLDKQGYVSWIKLLKSFGHIELDYMAVVGAFGDMQFPPALARGRPVGSGSEKIQVPNELGPVYEQTWKFER